MRETNQTNNVCPSCSVRLSGDPPRSISDERRPLLLLPLPQTQRRYDGFYPDCFFMIVLIILLVSGIGIGTYLLLNEGKDSVQPGRYQLVTRAEWHALPPTARPMRFTRTPLHRVAITASGTPACHNASDCLDAVVNLQRMQIVEQQHYDIGSNFLIGDDGRIYEGLGWSYWDGDGMAEELSVTLIGDFDDDEPTSQQIDNLRILLQIAIERRIVDRCYGIAVKRRHVRTLLPHVARLQFESYAGCYVNATTIAAASFTNNNQTSSP